MKKAMEGILSIYLALFLTGCMAFNSPAQAVTAIDPGQTLRGMQAAINGQPGTFVLQQGENLLLGWPSATRYAWVVFNGQGDLANAAKTLCGQRACPELMSDFYKWLEANGWQSIPTGAVPAAVASTIRQLGYLFSLGASLPVLPVLLMPLTIDPMELLNPQVGA